MVENNSSDKTIFGFWLYLMTDLLMFAALFATYAVLRNNTFGGPSGLDLFNLQFVLAETLILLTSSFTVGLAVLAARSEDRKQLLNWLLVTFILGCAFLSMELLEFSDLIKEGHTWTQSAFLSSYFTLVGTHGLHIFAGLFWLLTVGLKILTSGLSNSLIRKVTLFSLFWHFLDIVWIFIFTFVYLMS